MMGYREMAQDAGLHIDGGMTLDEAAAWLEQEEREAWERHLAEQERTKVWGHCKPSKHFWAFYYFCKRQGDRVELVHHGDGTKTLIVQEGES